MNKHRIVQFAYRLYRWLDTPLRCAALLIAVFVLLPLAASLAFGSTFWEKVLVFAACSLGLLSVAEVVFRFVYRLYMGCAYQQAPRLPFEDIYIEPHPYLPFIYKKRFPTQKGGEANYPLHNGVYRFEQTTSNSLRFMNGPTGEREILIPKPEGLFRVDCIGASTTGNYIWRDGKGYSYPMEMEKALRSQYDGSLEVNNCGEGGYNSADIFVRFALQVIDTRPDVVVIYHAYNDISAYLTEGFDSDYSHCRRNLGETYWLYAISSKIPFIPLKFLDAIVFRALPRNIRYSLLQQVSKGVVDTNLSPEAGLQTYRRNIRHIIDLCRCNSIDVVLSTYCHFLHDEIKDDPLHRLYANLIQRENAIMKELGAQYGLTVVDNAALVPQDSKYFVDSVHFTPEGMRLIAANIAKAVRQFLPESAKP